MARGSNTTLPALCLFFAPAVALAAAPKAKAAPKAEAALKADASVDVPAPAEARKDRPWIKRWAPEANTADVGLYGGVLLTSRRIELFEADLGLPDQGYRPLVGLAPDFGLRIGYSPLRWFGVEAEGGAMPTRTTTSDAALLWTARGSLVGQLGLWSVTPFVLVGGGLLGVASERSSVGNDVDASFHAGGGVKLFITRYTMLRLDVRDIIAARRGYDAGVIHNPEVLLGLSITLGRHRDQAPPPPPDTDGDGIDDPDDECVTVPGIPEYHGCPIPDADDDGIDDPDDECVDEPGVPEYHGCPVPDTDGDGIADPDDECIDELGIPEYHGCPIPDTDGDGVLDPYDDCIDEPETANGFRDADGCPDEVPVEVARFTGVIQGIFFESNEATIRTKSEPVLQKALAVFEKYPSVKVEISGHTDDRGTPEHNLELSERRAEAVKQYLVDAGVDPARITTRGAGQTEPLQSNKTKRGRAKNRRIEFTLRSH